MSWAQRIYIFIQYVPFLDSRHKTVTAMIICGVYMYSVLGMFALVLLCILYTYDTYVPFVNQIQFFMVEIREENMNEAT